MATHPIMESCSQRHVNHTHESKHRTRALLQAAGGELILWCPSCRSQITRVKDQVTLPTLALAEVLHINVCKKFTSTS
jgi:hypothetical protein